MSSYESLESAKYMTDQPNLDQDSPLVTGEDTSERLANSRRSLDFHTIIMFVLLLAVGGGGLWFYANRTALSEQQGPDLMECVFWLNDSEKTWKEVQAEKAHAQKAWIADLQHKQRDMMRDLQETSAKFPKYDFKIKNRRSRK